MKSWLDCRKLSTTTTAAQNSMRPTASGQPKAPRAMTSLLAMAALVPPDPMSTARTALTTTDVRRIFRSGVVTVRRVFNFSAGPAVLPQPVLETARDEMLDWHGSGMSVMEMSHRGKEFIAIHAQAEAALRELLAIPRNYKVLFLQGGAIAENAIVPMNLLRGRALADYINTGEWSKKSIKEAKKYCSVHVAASSEDRGFTYIPPQD